MRSTHWKHAIDDLRGHAAAVVVPPTADESTVSARQAAAILSGICGLIARRWDVETMQRTCAEMARLEPIDFGRLPTQTDGTVAEPMALLASVARSVRSIAGEGNLRAALSFWATEDDPAVWNQIAA